MRPCRIFPKRDKFRVVTQKPEYYFYTLFNGSLDDCKDACDLFHYTGTIINKNVYSPRKDNYDHILKKLSKYTMHSVVLRVYSQLGYNILKEKINNENRS